MAMQLDRLKRHRNFIEDDLEEMVLTPEERKEAYIHLTVERLAGAGTQEQVSETIDCAKFKRSVMERKSVSPGENQYGVL
ncbi:uncharacterized protein L3040_003802 [Drepanopeziza brunnea f. sp. 'multigermtubi']|uniref:uncharacterized protein n=1 Tax=Drepanopeziza brunnea f. sp. 'multigermtubi' TaxID=698441 RepID=UPI0023A06014|nr:hypothetical protein L3040_003802 [Drepanopeziza brunnea f. sp. 'multigermtubi']